LKILVYAVWSLGILVTFVVWLSFYDPDFADAQEIEEVSVTIVSHASTLGDKAYQPNPLEVILDSTVKWTNDDFSIHTVTEDGGGFSSGLLRPDDAFALTFNEAGTYGYYCELHPSMVGRIKVL
jgi:plastocyanin